jgi:hypothetical protein
MIGEQMANHSTSPIPSNIEDLAWIDGRWSGYYGEERIEEHWSKPDGGTIMGMFRWFRDGKVYFFELFTVEEEENSLVLRIKHFHPGLEGWEEKNDSVTFDLTEMGKTRVVWSRRDKGPMWLIYEKDWDRLQGWFEKPDDEPDKVARFDYQLMPAP